MPKYKVKVDHVTAYDVMVEAPDEEQAEEDAVKIIEDHLIEDTIHLAGETVTSEEERFDIESVALVPEPKA